MTKNKEHRCVFSLSEIEELKKTPLQIASIGGKMSIIIALLITFIAIFLVPTGIIIVQASKMGSLDMRMEYVEKTIQKEFKKLYWTEKAHKEARDAVKELLRELKKERSPAVAEKTIN